MKNSTLYNDGEIICDEAGLLIRRYYPWDSKRIPYSDIRKVSRLPILIRKWRVWAQGIFGTGGILTRTGPGRTSLLNLTQIAGFIRPLLLTISIL